MSLNNNLLFFLICTFFIGCSGFESNLINSNTGPSLVGEVSSSSVRMGNRYYIKSVFDSVFIDGSDGQSFKTNAENIISTQIFENADQYGGTCLKHDNSNCRANKPIQYHTLPQSSFISTRGDAGIIKACSSLLDLNGMLDFLKNKAAIPLSRNPASEDISKMYSLFNPAQNISNEANTALLNLSNNVAQSGGDQVAQWKLLTYTLCIDPDLRVP